MRARPPRPRSAVELGSGAVTEMLSMLNVARAPPVGRPEKLLKTRAILSCPVKLKEAVKSVPLAEKLN